MSSAPTMTTVPTSRPTNSGPCVGNVPLVIGIAFLAARLPAAASERNEEQEAADQHGEADASGCTRACWRVMPANALPLLPVPLV